MINWAVWGVKLCTGFRSLGRVVSLWCSCASSGCAATSLQSFKSERFIPESFCIEPWRLEGWASIQEAERGFPRVPLAPVDVFDPCFKCAMPAAHSPARARAPAARPADPQRLLRLIQTAGSAGRQLRRWLTDRLVRFELTDSEFQVLWLCAQSRPSDGWVQGDLAQAAGISPAQTSSLVERLRQRGLIEMKRSTIDRRRQVWHLLAQGEDLLFRIRTGLESVAHRLDALVTPEEQEAAARLFDRLVDAAERSTAIRPFNPAEADEKPRKRAARGGRS